MLYYNNSKGNEKSVLLRTGLSHAISKLSIVFNSETFNFLGQNRKVFKGWRVVAR